MKNQLKTLALLGALAALLIGIGGSMGPGYLYLFTALAVALNLGAYLFSDRIVLALHRARAIDPLEGPGIHRIVGELATRAGLPKPRVFLIEEPHANAFATGRDPKRAAVAVTRGILDLLDERELRSVLAHELAHVRNRDILVSTIAATLATAITHLAHALSFAGLFGGRRDEDEGSPAGGLLFALLAPVAAALVQLGISRSREYLADETGARMAGDPHALASALAKLHASAELRPRDAVTPATASLFIVNPIAGAGGILSWFSTHPPPEERIRRLHELARSGAWRDLTRPFEERHESFRSRVVR